MTENEFIANREKRYPEPAKIKAILATIALPVDFEFAAFAVSAEDNHLITIGPDDIEHNDLVFLVLKSKTPIAPNKYQWKIMQCSVQPTSLH